MSTIADGSMHNTTRLSGAELGLSDTAFTRLSTTDAFARLSADSIAWLSATDTFTRLSTADAFARLSADSIVWLSTTDTFPRLSTTDTFPRLSTTDAFAWLSTTDTVTRMPNAF